MTLNSLLRVLRARAQVRVYAYRSAAAEARRSGLWTSTEITDTLWPARDTRTRPLMPLRRGHMAMLVAAGFLDNLCLEAEDRRILVKGRTSKEMVMVEDSPEKEARK